MSPLAQALTIICAIGTSTAAGTFFTLSAFTIHGPGQSRAFGRESGP